jgi:hypothetical protein
VRKAQTICRQSSKLRPWFERLEDRLAPAVVSDGGTAALTLVLGANENLGIIASAAGYALTTNQTFTALGAADPANQTTAFRGFGSKNLTLTSAGIGQYATGIRVSDTGAGSSVTFNDSGASSYANNFTIALTNAAAGAISFNGKSSFGAFNLQAATTFNILLNNGAALTSSSGNLTFRANQQATPTGGSFTGITLNNAAIKSTGAGVISIQGTGGAAGGHGVLVSGSTITGGTGPATISGVAAGSNGVFLSSGTISSAGGDVAVTGQGSIGVDANIGQLSAGGNGNVTVQGTGTAVGDGIGVEVSGATLTSSGGNVQITGTGAGTGARPTSGKYGVFLDSNGVLSAGGAGALSVTGTGSPTATSNNNYGVNVNSGTITSSGGNVLVSGQGGGSGSSFNNHGVNIGSSGSVTAGGKGTVTVQGAGGDDAIGGGFGVAVAGNVSSGGGDVRVVGLGGGAGPGSFNYGINVTGGFIGVGGTGNLTVDGTGGPNAVGDAVGVAVASGTSISTPGGNVNVIGTGNGVLTPSILVNGTVATTPTGTITLVGDNLQLGGGSVSAGNRSVTLLPKTPGRPIILAGGVTPGALNLDPTALANITAGALDIGDTQSGPVTVRASITLPAPASVQLTSSGDIIFDQGSFNTAGGTLTLAPGTTGAVQPLTSGTDVTVAPAALQFARGANLAIAIHGALPDQYSQFSVDGDVNLTGANLVLGGNAALTAGQMLLLVNNQGSHPVVGTFNGLGEGGGITNILGSGLNATRSYQGGDGNDVVLTIQPATTVATFTTVSASTASALYGQSVTFTASVHSPSGTPTGSVEFFDATTGADLGKGTLQNQGSGTATWAYATTPRQLQATGGGPDVIQAVFTGAGNFLGSSGILVGGETVAPIVVTVSGVAADNKVYDQTTAATLNLASTVLAGVLPGDSVQLSAANISAAFASKNAGAALPVTVTGLALIGPQAANYVLAQSTLTLAADITPKPLTVTGIRATDKVADGTTAAALITGTPALRGVLTGDNVTLGTTGLAATFASAAPDNGIPVTVTGLTLSGAQAANYTLAPLNLTANINLPPAPISDGGTAVLTIPLASNQTLSITSTGTSYTFTSNQVIRAVSATDPANQSANFKGLGTTSVTLTSAGLAQYTGGIKIVDIGVNDSVRFTDSGPNAFANPFIVSLANPQQAPSCSQAGRASALLTFK